VKLDIKEEKKLREKSEMDLQKGEKGRAGKRARGRVQKRKKLEIRQPDERSEGAFKKNINGISLGPHSPGEQGDGKKLTSKGGDWQKFERENGGGENSAPARKSTGKESLEGNWKFEERGRMCVRDADS